MQEIDRLIQNAKLHFPYILAEAEEYTISSVCLLTIKLKNGDVLLYDDIDNTIRSLPRDKDNLTEDQCRREFGERLRRLLLYKGITNSELAEKTGLHTVQISNYIHGNVAPSFYKVDKIAKALGCSIDELRYF